MRAAHRWMVNLFVALGLLIFNVTGTHAQINAQLAVEPESNKIGFPICGTTLLTDEQEMVRAYLAAHPGIQEQMRLQKTSAWNFQVNDKKNWFAYDYTEQSHYSVPSTCRAVGTNCYIFVEDAIWGTRVSQTNVNTVLQAFDASTPANPSKGIYTMDVEAFGAPPNVDNDPRIIILILDIKDQYDGPGTPYIAGYFSSRNETNLVNSNQAEVYYVDANPTNLSDLSDPTGLITAAHEFQHMIHYNYDSGENSASDGGLFVNEGCSMLAEVHCGYEIDHPERYVSETNRYLFGWRSNTDSDVLRDYSRAARFMTYMRDQFGIGLMKFIVSNPNHGLAGLDGALTAYGSPVSFGAAFINWLIANILDDSSVDPAYAYVYPSLPKAVGLAVANPNMSSGSRTVDRLAAEYFSFTSGSDLRIVFNLGPNTLPVIKAVEIGPAAKRVLPVMPNTEFHEPEFGTTYTEIHFVVINTSQSLTMPYSFQSSGIGPSAVELKWDQTEPTGYLGGATGDSLCVTFDSVFGGKLDSIRVALRRIGSMTGGIYRSKATGSTPLGERLAVPITVTSDVTPPVINPAGPYPYPIPYPGWRTVDLRSYNISTDQSFAVAFRVAGDPTQVSNTTIMVSKYPSESPLHSFTYITQPSSGSPRWGIVGVLNEDDKVWQYHIRAYVSFGTVGVEQTVELMPSGFLLSQNYPNPFNPGTKIKFSLPQTGHATLKIYNMLGQEVAALIDGDLISGAHEVEWRPNGLPSGVYSYRLQAGDHSESKQLLLLK